MLSGTEKDRVQLSNPQKQEKKTYTPALYTHTLDKQPPYSKQPDDSMKSVQTDTNGLCQYVRFRTLHHADAPAGRLVERVTPAGESLQYERTFGRGTL